MTARKEKKDNPNHQDPEFNLARFGEQGLVLSYQQSGFFLFGSNIPITIDMLSRLCKALKEGKDESKSGASPRTSETGPGVTGG